MKCLGGDAGGVGGQDYINFEGGIIDGVSCVGYAGDLDESVPVLSIKQQ